MATAITKLATILSIILTVLLLISHPQMSFSTDIEDDEEYEYVIDTVQSLNARPGNQFLARTRTRIRKGARCDPIGRNMCNGVSVNNGTGILHCCKKHCRNILGDWNNCGGCGLKCGFGQRCCRGTCTNTGFNVDHCGKCNRKCLPGIKCEYGACGYA